ncbi:hypothetical protein V2J09_022339, partial [Rumex salicifolius]
AKFPNRSKERGGVVAETSARNLPYFPVSSRFVSHLKSLPAVETRKGNRERSKGFEETNEREMLTCITCAKQTDEREEGRGGRGTPRTRESVRSLTSQIRDMALKLSGAYKHCKPCTSPSGFRKEYRSYPEYDTASDGVPFPCIQPVTSSLTPVHVSTTSSYERGGRTYSRFVAGQRIQAEQESCTRSAMVLEDEDEPKEWMAQVEPGVQITFVTLPNGGNDLKRIRFSREMFDKWQAQRWWGENYDRITELYNVQKFNQQALSTPSVSEDEQRDSSYTRVESARDSLVMSSSVNRDWTPTHYKSCGTIQSYNAGSRGHGTGGGPRTETSSVDASRTTISSIDEEASVSVSNASDLETEWVEQDEPGVYITIRQIADGSRELRRVRFSRERFGDVHAKLWWERNRERIQAQYL